MELELISTDDLVGELQKRFDVSIFAGIKDQTEAVDFVETHWKGGNRFTQLGLLDWTRYLITKHWRNK